MKLFTAPVQSFLIVVALLALAAAAQAAPTITEVMAANKSTLADEDGAFSDWLELHNPDATAVDLNGWHLTDTAENKTRWRLPAVVLPPGGYLVIFASNKDRADPGAPLHTNFALSADGEYLGLVHADGLTVVSELTFPASPDDRAFGRPTSGSSAPGFLLKPTPREANSAPSASIDALVTFSEAAGPFRESFTLYLSGASGGQQIRYVVTPAGASADAPEPTATSPIFNDASPIKVDQSLLIRAAVFSADGASRGPVTNAYYARLGSSLNTFSSQLPVLVIDSLGTGPLQKDGIDHPSWVYSYSARGNATPTFNTPPEMISPLTTTVRGSSSAEFPKKGYNIKFTDAQGEEREQGILDLPAHEKWALVAPWSFDFSYINNVFVYAVSNQIGRWAPRTRLVEVFFNADGGDIEAADYAGIYVVTDRVEQGDDRVDIASLKKSDTTGSAVTGGYLLKIDVKDEDEIGWRTEHEIPEDPYSTVILVSPDADDTAPAQLTYIQSYVQRMENALFADRASEFGRRTYLDYIDRASWVDHHLLNTFVCNPDAFVRSAYFNKDQGKKLVAGPVWDFDRALGSYWDERSRRWDVWTGIGGDVWRTGWWGVLAQDPEFMQDWIDRWQTLRTDALSTERLLALIGTFADQIGTAAANRDSTRWPDNVSPQGGYAEQIEYLQSWVKLRAGWIDEQFVNAPAITSSADAITFTPPAGAQLAYTLDGSDPRSLGGGVAPNAQLTSDPLTLPAGTNVHVRSYNEDLRDVFPGSPWSMAVGGPDSSPLAPRARLINISARASVGVGENALIAGVVVADTEGKRYLSRAVGPGLAAFGATGTVSDPQLSIFESNSVELVRNNGWETGPDASRMSAYAKSVGAFPLLAGSKDSALASELPAGAYTVQVTTPSDQPGIGLAELYELDENGRTVNLSTRARVRTGDGVMIGGFVVQGPAHKRMLIRAVGPALRAFGLSDALDDPVLTIFSGQEVLATNDRWSTGENSAAVATASQNAGAFKLVEDSEDAALLITLPPGAYTVEVRGKDDSEGVALLEIYEVP